MKRRSEVKRDIEKKVNPEAGRSTVEKHARRRRAINPTVATVEAVVAAEAGVVAALPVVVTQVAAIATAVTVARVTAKVKAAARNISIKRVRRRRRKKSQAKWKSHQKGNIKNQRAQV